MTSRQILESIRQDARRHQMASQETNIFYYDTNYNSDSDLESNARDKSDSQENVDKLHTIRDSNNYFTSIVNDREENVNTDTTLSGKSTEEQQVAELYKVNKDFDTHHRYNNINNNQDFSYDGSSTPAECENVALRMSNVETYINDNHIHDDDCKSPYKTNTHVYKDGNAHMKEKTNANTEEDVLHEVTTEEPEVEKTKGRIINNTTTTASLSPMTSPSSSPSMSVLLDITPIKTNTHNESNLSSDHTACPARRSSSSGGKVTVPMLALSTVHKLNYADTLQLNAQYIKSLTSSPMAMKTTSPSAPRDHAQIICTPDRAEEKRNNNNKLAINNVVNARETTIKEKPSTTFNNTSSNNNNKLDKNEESNRMMLLLKLEDDRSSSVEKNQIVDSPINLVYAKRTEVNSPSYHIDNATGNNNNNNSNDNLVLSSLNSLSVHRSDSISRIENSLALLQVELAKEKRHSIEAEQRAYALQREVEKYKSENVSLNAALEALKSGNSILSEAISPRKPRDVTEMDVVSMDQSEWMAQCHLLNEQVHELQKTISRQETELASKEERIRLLEHKLADQLLSGMLSNQTYPTSSSSFNNSNKNDNTTSVEAQRETSHLLKQIVHSVMLNKTNMASTKLANTISSSNNNNNTKSKMIDANMTLKPSEVDINDLHVQHRDVYSNNNNTITKMSKDHKDVIHRVCDDNDTEHSLLSSTLGDSHKLKTTKHPSDTIVSQRSVKTALTNTNTNTSNTQTSTNLNTGRTNRSNFSNSSIPDVLAHTRTTVQRLSTSDNEADKRQELISPLKNTNRDDRDKRTLSSIAEQNVSSVNNLSNEMKTTITKPSAATSAAAEVPKESSNKESNVFVSTTKTTSILPEGTNNVPEIVEHPQHVEKICKNEPASARLVLPSPHTRLYENKYHVHGMTHTNEDDDNNSINNKNDTKESEMKPKTKSARVKHHTNDGNIVSSRRKTHKSNNNNNSKSAEEPPLESNVVPFTVSARMRNKGKESKKRTTISVDNNTAPVSSVTFSEESQEHKEVFGGPSLDSSNTQSKEDDQEQQHNLKGANVQESIESEHIFIDTSQKNELNNNNNSNNNSSTTIINNVLHKKLTKPPPLTEDALRHKEMPSMASLNSALVLHVNSKIHTSSMDTLFNSSNQDKNVRSTINDHEDMVNLEVEDEEGNVNKTEKEVCLEKISNEVQLNNNIAVAHRKTNTPRRAVPSPLRSSMSNIMTKPSPRVSQRSVGGGGGARTPRKANEVTAKSIEEQTPSSTRSSKPNVATSTTTWTRNAMTPISKPTNKTLFDNSHGYKPQQRTGMFALSHFAPSTHQPSSLMNKKMQSINITNDNSNTSNNIQESNSVNIKQIKTPVRKEENDKFNKQPQSARRPVSTPRLTFRQAITPHATRPRSSSNNKHSVLIECEEGKVKDVFGISVEESPENKMKQMGISQSTELMTPLTVHTESMRLPEYAPEHSSTAANNEDNNDNDTPVEPTKINQIPISKNNIRHAKTPNEHSKRIASPRYNSSTPRYANTPIRRGTFHAETPNRYNRLSTNNKDVEKDKQQNNKFGHSKMEHSMSLLHKETPASEMLSYGSALLTLSAQRRSLVSNNINIKDNNKEHKGDLHSGRNANENASTARSRSNATVRRSMMNLNVSKTRPRILYTGKDHETAVMKGTTTTVTFRSPAPVMAESSRNTTELPMSESEGKIEHEVIVNNIERKEDGGGGGSTHRSSSRHTHSDKLRSSSPTHVMNSSSNTARGFNLYSSHDATATAMRIINDPEGMEDDSDEGEDKENEEQNNQNVKV